MKAEGFGTAVRPICGYVCGWNASVLIQQPGRRLPDLTGSAFSNISIRTRDQNPDRMLAGRARFRGLG